MSSSQPHKPTMALSSGTGTGAAPPPLETPHYLEPYVRAAGRHGAGFGSLLWASPLTQQARFHAFTRVCDFRGKTVLDVGCGRADLLDFLLAWRLAPAHYVGIEAVDELAAAAAGKLTGPGATPGAIVRGDFVADAALMFVGAEVVVFSGSLNTLAEGAFFSTLGRAFDATAGELVFNFLDSPNLAAAGYLAWRRPADVVRFSREMAGAGGRVREAADYLDGDRTIALRKKIG